MSTAKRETEREIIWIVEKVGAMRRIGKDRVRAVRDEETLTQTATGLVKMACGSEWKELLADWKLAERCNKGGDFRVVQTEGRDGCGWCKTEGRDG